MLSWISLSLLAFGAVWLIVALSVR